MKALLQLFAPPMLIGSVFAAFAACSHSQPPAPMSPAQKGMAADAAYSADLMLCVDKAKYPTRIESDFCVAQTKKRWGRP